MLRKIILVFLLLNGLLLNASLAADADSSSDNPVINKTSTTDKPEPTTTPTTVPTTTTEKTTTTTAATPTSTKPSNTTTATPTTTPTTTVAPTPAPPKPWPQNIGNWSVGSEQENVTCILFRAALLLHVPYKVDNVTKVANVEVPYNAAATGECEEIAQTITLSWKDENISFTFVYNSNGTATVDSVGPNKFALQNVAGVVYVNESTSAENDLTKVEFNIEKLDTYQTSANKSFKCESEETLKNKDGEGVQVKLAHAQVEAFRAKLDHTFGPAVECELDGAVADIVPIAVGASLAGLVVIVLIAYLIGRRRSRARGYQSV